MAVLISVHVVTGCLRPTVEVLSESQQRPSDLKSLKYLLLGPLQKKFPGSRSNKWSWLHRTRTSLHKALCVFEHDAGLEAHKHLRLFDSAWHYFSASFNGERSDIHLITLLFAVIRKSSSGRIHLAGWIPFAFLCLGDCAFFFFNSTAPWSFSPRQCSLSPRPREPGSGSDRHRRAVEAPVSLLSGLRLADTRSALCGCNLGMATPFWQVAPVLEFGVQILAPKSGFWHESPLRPWPKEVPTWEKPRLGHVPSNWNVL